MKKASIQDVASNLIAAPVSDHVTRASGKIPAAAPGEKSVRVNVDVPQELHRQVKSKLGLEGKTIRDLVIEAMRDYVK